MMFYSELILYLWTSKHDDNWNIKSTETQFWHNTIIYIIYLFMHVGESFSSQTECFLICSSEDEPLMTAWCFL